MWVSIAYLSHVMSACDHFEQGGGGEPEGALRQAIDTKFGDFESFKKSFAAATVAVQGSGWGWLGYDTQNKDLRITTCANQV